MSENKELDIIKSSSAIQSFQQQIEDAEKMAEIVLNSETFKGRFATKIEDPNDPEKQIIAYKKEDVISCILLGMEMGLPPMVSISFGRTLDKLAYFKVMKGKSLGLDAVTAMQHVYAYEKDGAIICGMSGAGINAVAVNGGVTYKMLKDFQPITYYRNQSNQFIGYDFKEDWVISNKGITKDELSKACLEEKKYPVKEELTFCTEILFKRKGWDDLIESYTLLDATEAGLYKGFNFEGLAEKGKPAWNANPKRVLTTRVLSIGYNRIGADIMGGLLPKEELDEIMNVVTPVKGDDDITPSETVQ